MSSFRSYAKFFLKIKVVAPLRSFLVRSLGVRTNRNGWEQRMLIVNLEALGDLIMFTGVLKHYKHRFPDTKISLLIKSGTGLEPFLRSEIVDEVIVVDYRRFAVNPWYGFGFIQALRHQGFSRVVNQDFSGAEVMGKIIAIHLGAQEVIGYEGMAFEYAHPFDIQQRSIHAFVRARILPYYTKCIRAISEPADRLPNAIRHYVAIYEGATGFHEADYAPRISPPNDVRVTEQSFDLQGKRYALLNVGASAAYKRWPLSRFAELSQAFMERGITPVLIGARSDAPVAEMFMRKYGIGVRNLVGQTSFSELVRLMGLAYCVLTNDTSTVHLAVALKRPCLCISGGGQFGMFQDYGYPDINIWSYTRTPCYGDNWQCGRAHHDSPAPCVDAVHAKDVLAKLTTLLEYLEDVAQKSSNTPARPFTIEFEP